MLSAKQIQTVNIKAPARLHLGFLDMHGGLGRRFGGFGLCLADIFTHISIRKSDGITAYGPSSQRAMEYGHRILNALGIKGGIEVTIHSDIFEHAGLGSGTQLSLAIGMAVVKLYALQTSIREVAILMQRGVRSGIGIGAFTQGGFLVDGGRGDETEIPPIVSHCYFPEAWRILLVFDRDMSGVNGHTERDIFNVLAPMQADISARICRLVLMQILPALAEKDCATFGSGIMQVQKIVGQYFSDIQQGHYSSRQVADCMPWMLDHGATGVGQSSWGPTGFAVYSNEAEARQALVSARVNWQREKNLDFCLCTAQNRAADVVIE